MIRKFGEGNLEIQKFSDEQLLNLYNQGLTDREMAKILNVSCMSVCYRRWTLGLVALRRNWAGKNLSEKEVKQRIEERYISNFEYNKKNREIRNEYMKEWRNKNREKIRKSWKKYCEKNKEKIRKSWKEYREKNREKCRKRALEYYYKNREKLRKKQKEYYYKNKKINKIENVAYKKER